MKASFLHFNGNYNEDKSYFIVVNGRDIVHEYAGQLIGTDKTRIRIFTEEKTLVVQTLLPKKRNWKEGNYKEYRYKIINVGYKDATTHLPAGQIYQLEKMF